MPGKPYEENLETARAVLKDLQTAYHEQLKSRGTVSRLKIKDREMEFASAADVLKQIRFWQTEVQRLETAAGVRSGRPRRIVSRF